MTKHTLQNGHSKKDVPTPIRPPNRRRMVEVCDQVMCQRMTNPSGTAPRPVIHLLELLSFQTATFAEFRLARERVGYGDEGPLFRAHGVPLNQGAPTRPSGPRPPNGHSMALIFSHPPLPLWFLSMFYFAFFCSFVRGSVHCRQREVVWAGQE